MRYNVRRWLAYAVGAVLVGTATVALSAPLDTLEACRTLEVSESTPQSVVDTRLGQGWYGDPTDHAERLYAPSCAR